MEENIKMNNKKKAIIITVVSIIAVLIIGLAIGVSAGYIVNKNNKKVNTNAQQISTGKNDNSNLNDEYIVLVDDTIPNTVDDENALDASLVDENAKLQEEQKEQEKNSDEASKKAEEEAKKKTEEAKKKTEETKKKEEIQKTTVTSNANNGIPYYIKVNYIANTVTIYGKDSNGNYTVPVKAMICSTGANTSIYNNGTYKTLGKSRWGQLIGPVWGQYCTRIFGGVLFHSVPYLKQNDNSTLEYWEYDRLGQNRSLGCIRLTVADAKWIYNNCPVGTSVQFYGSSNPGPLGKPSASKVSWAGDPYRGWDPTDPDPNNPWKTKAQEDAKKKAEEEAAAKKKAEEEAAAKKKAEEEAAAKKKAEEEAAAKKKTKRKAKTKKKKEEEAAAKKKAEEEAKNKSQNTTKNETKITNTTNTTKTTNTTNTVNKTN